MRKVGGDYEGNATVRAVFTLNNGALRYAIQYDAIPLVHIHSEHQLRAREDDDG